MGQQGRGCQLLSHTNLASNIAYQILNFSSLHLHLAIRFEHGQSRLRLLFFSLVKGFILLAQGFLKLFFLSFCSSNHLHVEADKRLRIQRQQRRENARDGSTGVSNWCGVR